MKKGKGKNSGLLPNSLRIISSCLKTVSTNASTVASTVRSAGASVAATISSSEDHKDQVTWAGFDRLELEQSIFKHVLLLGYLNGFQVLDVEDASSFSELVSKRDGPVSFLQMQPFPVGIDGQEGFRKSHPLLLVVAGNDSSSNIQNRTHLGGLGRDGNVETQSGNCVNSATAVYCFDALTLENKFSVLTYPVPQLAGQGTASVNVGHGPLAVGPRWLAYASNSPMPLNVGRLSPQNLSPSPGVSPSTSPGSGSLVARYAMESGKHLASGIIKYCQELLPDGSSSPVPSNAGWKVGRIAGTDMDNAGMVVVKDFVSRAIISQFKAHTSPISALCFDPSGTLLVTASVYGNNINIFRIMPSCTRKGSGVPSYDWSSSHVHLYKLHRGITSAMIQDICFSHFSQWIAIVSSKGTCHLFVLSPFGGETGFRIINSQGEEPSLLPVLSLPWWATSYSMSDQQSLPPPAPAVLSVVCRIKYSSFGWLNTVHSSAANATGKVFVPSGALAAVFHNSLLHSQQHVNMKGKPLEHLLVFTPSGHVVQHELLPSVGPEPCDSGPTTQSASLMNMQDDEFRVKVKPIQWWDVCRWSEWPERGDPCYNTFNRQDGTEIVQENTCSPDGNGLDYLDINDGVGEKVVECSAGKAQGRSLSNAEVQLNFGRLPIWQKSKICFYTMNSVKASTVASGESEIEKICVIEVEIKQKELLPVLDHFHYIRPSWNERGFAGERSSSSSSPVSHQAEDKTTAEVTVICHSKPASLSSTESSDGGSSRRTENFLELDQVASCQMLNEIYLERMGAIIIEPSLQNHILPENLSFLSGDSKHVDVHADSSIGSSLLFSANRVTPRLQEDAGVGINDGSGAAPDDDAPTGKLPEVPSMMHNTGVMGQSFQDDHCKSLEHLGSDSFIEVVTDDVDGSSGQHEGEQPGEDGEDGDMLGVIFAFSE